MQSIKDKNINVLIQEYLPLIIKTVSGVSGKYVSVYRDDEFSIGLMAFKEAVDKYNEERGNFSSFAKIVITSRVKNYIAKESKHNDIDSIEALKEVGIDFADNCNIPLENSNELAIEISNLKAEINEFGFSFEDLVKESPKHKDTRNRAIIISEHINKNTTLKNHMYDKKRLPIKQITLIYSITEKTIKKSKKFIISVVIILDKKFRNLGLWIRR